MYVDDKLKQKDARSRTITEKRIMDILFEVEMGTTCVTPTQTQNSISMSLLKYSIPMLQHLFKGSIPVVHHELKPF